MKRYLTLDQAIEAIDRNETAEAYAARMNKLRKLSTERDFLEDAIEVLGDDPRAESKRRRLDVVKKQIENLQ